MKELNSSDILTYTLTGITPKGLADKFGLIKNIDIKNKFEDILNNSNILKIIGSIEHFRNFKSTKEVIKEIVVNDKNKKDAEKKKKNGENLTDDEKIIIKKDPYKEEKSEIREALLTLLSRIPLFMYLTNTSEKDLKEVILNTEPELFLKTTGITSEQFNELESIGIINTTDMDGYIAMFKKFEDSNYEQILSELFNKHGKGE